MCECKVCKTPKVRMEAGLRSGVRGKRYKDGSGRDWNGYTCPDCRAVQNRERTKKYARNSGKLRAARAEREMSDTAVFGPASPLYPPKMRACRKCASPTPNYYFCGPCHNYREASHPEMYIGGLDSGEILMDSRSGTFAKGVGFRY